MFKATWCIICAFAIFVALSSSSQAALYSYKNGGAYRGDWYYSDVISSVQNSEQALEAGVNVYVNNGVFEAKGDNYVIQSYPRGRYSTKCGWNNINWAANRQTKISCSLKY